MVFGVRSIFFIISFLFYNFKVSRNYLFNWSNETRKQNKTTDANYSNTYFVHEQYVWYNVCIIYWIAMMSYSIWLWFDKSPLPLPPLPFCARFHTFLLCAINFVKVNPYKYKLTVISWANDLKHGITKPKTVRKLMEKQSKSGIFAIATQWCQLVHKQLLIEFWFTCNFAMWHEFGFLFLHLCSSRFSKPYTVHLVTRWISKLLKFTGFQMNLHEKYTMNSRIHRIV